MDYNLDCSQSLNSSSIRKMSKAIHFAARVSQLGFCFNNKMVK